jgi:uncharacterized protein (DUF934 family)
VIAADQSLEQLPPTGKLIVPLVLWQAHRDLLAVRVEAVGVWLEGHDDPLLIAGDVAKLPLIAIHFAAFKDGRGYSLAYLLRNRYGFKGELRALGDVLRDQLFYLRRVGFNAFAIRADRDADDALKGLTDFSETYQGSIDQPQPLFRRRGASSIAGVTP